MSGFLSFWLFYLDGIAWLKGDCIKDRRWLAFNSPRKVIRLRPFCQGSSFSDFPRSQSTFPHLRLTQNLFHDADGKPKLQAATKRTAPSMHSTLIMVEWRDVQYHSILHHPPPWKWKSLLKENHSLVVGGYHPPAEAPPGHPGTLWVPLHARACEVASWAWAHHCELATGALAFGMSSILECLRKKHVKQRTTKTKLV